MKSIKTSADLKLAIQQTKMQQANELILLKEEFTNSLDRLKPINLIKDAFKEAVTAPDLKTDIINAAIGLTTGIVAKKIIIGKTLNPLSKLLGVMLEVFVTNKVTQNAAEIKSVGSMILNKIFHKNEEPEKV